MISFPLSPFAAFCPGHISFGATGFAFEGKIRAVFCAFRMNKYECLKCLEWHVLDDNDGSGDGGDNVIKLAQNDLFSLNTFQVLKNMRGNNGSAKKHVCLFRRIRHHFDFFLLLLARIYTLALVVWSFVSSK